MRRRCTTADPAASIGALTLIGFPSAAVSVAGRCLAAPQPVPLDRVPAGRQVDAERVTRFTGLQDQVLVPRVRQSESRLAQVGIRLHRGKADSLRQATGISPMACRAGSNESKDGFGSDGLGGTAPPRMPGRTRSGCGRGGRTSRPMAAFIIWLLSDDASNVNGAILPSDGGWSVA
jgi:NAD(P)-dependent dehydrogenase (short-subunit alcohol dehydrogenase family)